MATRKSFFIWRARKTATLSAGGLADVSVRQAAPFPGMPSFLGPAAVRPVPLGSVQIP